MWSLRFALASGLAADEAFLVAVKRMGNLDAVSREFAREHSERLWKQLVVAAAADGTANRGAPRETVVAVALAFAAAAAVKLPELFGFPRMGLFNDQVLFFPNKLAALGENLVLLVNLTWSAWLYARFLGGRGPFSALERWQTAYLPVYAAWAAFVVVAFPPLFGFK